MKYVYLIQSLEDGYYKIGVSKSPVHRLYALQTGNSSELKLIETYQSEHAHRIEKTLQRHFSYLRKEGEWFDMGISHESSFLTECKRIERNFNILKESGNVFI
jgi:hypothetical protein